MENEIWVPVKGYEGAYEVSNLGKIKSLHSNKLLKLNRTKRTKNYTAVIVHLSKFGKNKFFLVSRLVAEAFIPNPKNKPQVNHIDFDPTNNKVSNLEWCTAKENHTHSMNADRIKITSILERDPIKVEVIEYLLSKGFSYHEIARLFLCSTYSIKNAHIKFIEKLSTV